MNEASPGTMEQVATSQMANLRVGRSRGEGAETAPAAENQPPPRAKPTLADFELGPVLGEGSYSRVVRATQKSDKRAFAIKVVEKALVIREKKEKYIAREKEALLLCKHPMVVHLHSTFQDGTRLYFVMELCSKELFSILDKHKTLGEECARFIAAELVEVLSFIHSRGVIHRDFKPENVLMSEAGHVKLTDFGSSRIMKPGEGRTKSFCGTAEYVSPELLENIGACQSSDLWAFGCIVYQMFAGKVPFRGGSEYLTFQQILQLEYEFPEVFPEKGRKLVEALLVIDPCKRLGADSDGMATKYDDLRAHTFFEGIEWKEPPLYEQTPPPITYPYKPPAPAG